VARPGSPGPLQHAAATPSPRRPPWPGHRRPVLPRARYRPQRQRPSSPPAGSDRRVANGHPHRVLTNQARMVHRLIVRWPSLLPGHMIHDSSRSCAPTHAAPTRSEGCAAPYRDTITMSSWSRHIASAPASSNLMDVFFGAAPSSDSGAWTPKCCAPRPDDRVSVVGTRRDVA
jgi:hypothetical protein